MAATPTFYFYDLETSGLNPRDARIMQFGGQRTDLKLNPIGKPQTFFIKLTPDSVPDPWAVLLTGITPQKTLADGHSEQAFLDVFYSDIATPGTIFAGYNTVRFDDEFMRYLNYRNFYDAYEWQYKEDRSRWDMLDVVRMARALRPEAIKWPVDSSGKPSNRLELLTGINNIEHSGAHDAVADVLALIELARLLRSRQPKLFDFLLGMRTKQAVAQLVEKGQPFVYTSGKYPSEFEKTTIAVLLAPHPRRQGALVYDLRYDPTPFMDLSPEALVEAWRRKKDDPGLRLPVKDLLYNRCPAVAPLSVLDEASQQRLKLTPEKAGEHHQMLLKNKTFKTKLLKALGILDEQQMLKFKDEVRPIDAQLYDGFFSDGDRRAMVKLHERAPDSLAALASTFQDRRLKQLLPLYKARNFEAELSPAERSVWESYRAQKLMGGGEDSRLARYFAMLEEIRGRPDLSDQQTYTLEELQLWGESILPED